MKRIFMLHHLLGRDWRWLPQVLTKLSIQQHCWLLHHQLVGSVCTKPPFQGPNTGICCSTSTAWQRPSQPWPLPLQGIC
jgi:hypothetical protein